MDTWACLYICDSVHIWVYQAAKQFIYGILIIICNYLGANIVPVAVEALRSLVEIHMLRLNYVREINSEDRSLINFALRALLRRHHSTDVLSRKKKVESRKAVNVPEHKRGKQNYL